MYEVMYYHSSWVTQPPPDVFVCAGGPQMIASSARYAQGIFVGDHLPQHVARINKTIQAERASAGRKDDDFRLLNFWAWHVKENQDDARQRRVSGWSCGLRRGRIDPPDRRAGDAGICVVGQAPGLT
ncbi:MAG: LLM class flavin-dependent oxidoreductase [Chromatiales bacterium]|jgi:alkanesulfonate monooxygenase SsuD/methylene tetrahydromethanopterin reductase-like flavin-dependent oxidoreductase (luciferase family)|nr:MAG: LLM class flavin-dependent oxidoreductase [Chromatiales bacterium]